MTKQRELIENLLLNDLINSNILFEELLKEKLKIKLLEKKVTVNQKRPTTISVKTAKDILKTAGYIPREGGKHQTVWKHSDPSKPDFALPFHSGDLSPAISRKVWALQDL